MKSNIESQIELEKLSAKSSKKEDYPHRLSFMREVYEAHFGGEHSYRDTLILCHGVIYEGKNLEKIIKINEGNRGLIGPKLSEIFQNKSEMMALLYPNPSKL